MTDKPLLHDETDLPEESRAILASAYKHACVALPDLNEESFVNGFLYGVRFGGGHDILKEFMKDAY